MMAQEFRYPLTRICLRSGTLTLPMALLEVFPEDGDVSVQDTVRGTELVVRVDGREVSGLESYLEAHALEVNDTIVVKVLDDGGIGLTAEKRARKPDYRRPDVLGRLLDEVIEADVPMTEGEIRALHPDLPSGFPLREALEGEPRLTLHQGRWRSTLALEEEQRAAERLAEQRRAEAERRAEAAVKAAEEREAVRRESERRAAEEREAEQRSTQRHEAERRHEAARAAQREAAERKASERASAKRDAAERMAAQRSEQGRTEPMAAAAAADAAATEAQSTTDSAEPEAASEGADAERRAVERASRERLAEHAEEDARAIARRERDARADARAAERGAAGEADDDTERFDWNEPVARGFRFPWQRGKAKSAKVEGAREAAARKERDRDKDRDKDKDKDKDPFRLDRLGEARPSATRPSVVPAPRPGLFPGDTALNSASMSPGDPKKSKRAREAFAGLGYRIEGLAHGQLMLHADLGRRQYRVLLHVLPDGERLDWAALLARRRDSGAVYLAVLGDHRDLHRLTAPADLARATLWSWAGLERMLELSKTVMLGPVDLEPHFERDGAFEYGLERFERTIAKRVQERGVVSAVLTRLAGLRAPAVFLVDDIVGEPDVPRDQIVRVLERLAEAPFHLISKVDSGEFCLRYRVQDALEQVADYATSLRARLPERQRERVRGLDDDGLAAAFDPIAADDVDLANVPARVPSPTPPSPTPPSPAAPKPMPSPERLAQATASGGLRVVREERVGPGGGAYASGAATGETDASGAGTSAAATTEATAKNAATNRAGDHAPENDASPPGTTSRGGQDALFGEGFGGGGFGEEPADEVDVSEVIKPKTRGRKRG